MKSNKELWKERNAQGKTKLDVAIETQMSADVGEINNSVEKYNSKLRKVSVDATAEAKKAGEEKAAKEEAERIKKADELAEQQKAKETAELAESAEKDKK